MEMTEEEAERQYIAVCNALSDALDVQIAGMQKSTRALTFAIYAVVAASVVLAGSILWRLFG